MRGRAITLIELLVVIAIVATLAAILFPVFAQAKLAAKATASLRNVRSLGTASALYAGDADDVSVPNGNDDPASPFSVRNTPDTPWGPLLMPYLRDLRLLQDPLTAPETERMGLPGSLAWAYLTQYGYAFTVHSPAIHDSTGYRYAPLAATARAMPARTVLFVEKKTRNGHADWNWDGSTIWGANVVNPPLCHGETTVDTVPASVCVNLAYWGSDSPSYEGQTFEEGSLTGGVAFRAHARSIVTWADGHVKAALAPELAAGTNWTPATPSASVRIIDKDRYVWDAE